MKFKIESFLRGARPDTPGLAYTWKLHRGCTVMRPDLAGKIIRGYEPIWRRPKPIDKQPSQGRLIRNPTARSKAISPFWGLA